MSDDGVTTSSAESTESLADLRWSLVFSALGMLFGLSVVASFLGMNVISVLDSGSAFPPTIPGLPQLPFAVFAFIEAICVGYGVAKLHFESEDFVAAWRALSNRGG